MKTLKEFGLAIIAFIACISMVACSNDNGTLVLEDEQEVYTVHLGWGGELDVAYEPLSRATDATDLYGIQVYSVPDKELEGEETWSPYAYGLFDNTDNISVNLLKGYKYKFIATIIKDGLKKMDSEYTGNGYKGLMNPFYGTGGPTALEHKFNYSSSWYFNDLGYGNTVLLDGNFYEHPNTDRYYGEEDNYTPDKNSNIKIKMKRASFGAKFIAKGKAANNGSLEIEITGAPKMTLTPSADKKHISDNFTFSNVKEAWAHNGNYSEVIEVTISWHRADGSTIPLGTHEITYKRNATTVVNVNVVNDASSSGVGYEIDETELGEMAEDKENETTIEDGTIVEKEVETN